VAGVAALTIAACTGEVDDDVTPTTSSVATTTTVVARADDGQLVLGVLLPTTGPGAQLGTPMAEAVRVAVDRINAAGGVLDAEVAVVEVDEGSSASASLAVDTLLGDGVDAIIGPASSLVALSDLDLAVAGGVLTCSPSATALSLDEFPDDGLFFRTVPSDSLQARAIAQVAEQTGAPTMAIAFLDDPYGRGLRDAVRTSARGRNLTVLTTVGFSGDDDDLTEEVAQLLVDDPGVVVVLGDGDDGGRFVSALDDAIGESGSVPPVIVNDAVRDMTAAAVEALSTEFREALRGVAPVAFSEADPELTGVFAANAYDCANLIALATVQAGSDAPRAVASQMASVSVGGSVCRSFEACADRIGRGLQIDYEGPSGNTELSTRTGDPTSGRFEVFRFDDNGVDILEGVPFTARS
jgi:branched-chain amino acid transport system substrate-binding protein